MSPVGLADLRGPNLPLAGAIASSATAQVAWSTTPGHALTCRPLAPWASTYRCTLPPLHNQIHRGKAVIPDPAARHRDLQPAAWPCAARSRSTSYGPDCQPETTAGARSAWPGARWRRGWRATVKPPSRRSLACADSLRLSRCLPSLRRTFTRAVASRLSPVRGATGLSGRAGRNRQARALEV